MKIETDLTPAPVASKTSKLTAFKNDPAHHDSILWELNARLTAEREEASALQQAAAEEVQRLKAEHLDEVKSLMADIENLHRENAHMNTQLNYERSSSFGLLLHGIAALGREKRGFIGRAALFIHYAFLRPSAAADLAAVAASGYFDPDYYLTCYPDVAESKTDPLLHYMEYGFLEDRNPSAAFNGAYYLGRYPDVARSGMNPLLHYVKYGSDENRRVAPGAKRAKKRRKPVTRLSAIDLQNLVELYERGGIEPLLRRVKGQLGKTPRSKRAVELLKIAKALGVAGYGGAEVSISQEALKFDRSENVLRGAFWMAQRNRHYEIASVLALELEKAIGPHPSPEQAELLRKLKVSPTYLLSLLGKIVPKQPYQYEPVRGRICYVLHNSFPYSSGGYGARSQGLAAGLKAVGYDVICCTRPGFPIDIKPEMQAGDVPLRQTVEGVEFVRTLAPLRRNMTALDYMTESADAMEHTLRALRPEIVIAASNHVTGLPALIAARRLGAPFIYEIRGLWEITRVSRERAFEETPAFGVQKVLEAAVAKNAEHVFTLTEALREELIERGVPAEKLTLLPNSCDPERFMPISRDNRLAGQLGIPDGVPVIGYVGTFVVYEGLEDLAEACGRLKQQGVQFRLLIVGNENASGLDRGPITEEIARIAEQRGFADWLIMPGRVPHEVVGNYYSLIDVCPFPRKPWPVCEMVSPLKPLEALSMKKAVVVSSVRALTDMIEDGVNGLVFEKGNVESLASTLIRMIKSPEDRVRYGEAGRAWILKDRTWQATAGKAAEHLAKATVPQ